MSQEAVERVLGRMLTDERFRIRAGECLESAGREAGYQLNPHELLLLSVMEPHCFAELAGRLDPELRRAGGGYLFSGKTG